MYLRNRDYGGCEAEEIGIMDLWTGREAEQTGHARQILRRNPT